MGVVRAMSGDLKNGARVLVNIFHGARDTRHCLCSFGLFRMGGSTLPTSATSTFGTLACWRQGCSGLPTRWIVPNWPRCQNSPV